MNILYHHRTQGLGVEAVHIGEIVKALTSLGHTVDVLSPAGLNVLQKKNLKPTGSLSKMYHTISSILPEFFFELAEIAYNAVALRAILNQLKQKPYDFIYERYAIFNWAGVMAARRNHIPVILEINYTSFSPLVRKRNGFLKPFAHWTDKLIFSKTDAFAAVSTFLKDHLIALGVKSEKVIVTTNAADPETFNMGLSGKKIREQHKIGDKVIIGFTGGFYPWHGIDLLINAFKEVIKTNQESYLLLVGDGPLKTKMQEKVKILKLENDVLFTGRIAHDALADYVASFDIAIMPDSNTYGSPMKVFEYMAMGKPVVAPKLGPLEDAITDGKEGFLFKQQDVPALVSVLTQLIQNADKRASMGIKGRENIVLNHTWKINAERVLSLVEKSKSGT